MADEIDLEQGEPDHDETDRQRRRRERAARAAERRGEARGDAGGVIEGEIRGELTRAFDGIARARDARGDEELAEAIRQEGDAMTEGIVQVTRHVTVLRMPIVVLLNVVIILLAFGRVGGILLSRWQYRRMERAAERERAQAEVENGVPIYEQ